LVIRWGAWGDIIYCLPAIEALRKQYDYIHFETGERGQTLLKHHPAIDKITTFDIMKYRKETDKPREMTELMRETADVRWKTLEEVGWDKVVNFYQCLEVACISEEWEEQYFYTRERRQKIYGSKNIYDEHFKKAGIPMPVPFNTGTMYFGEEELRWMENWRKKHAGEFIVAVALTGSTPHKFPQYLKELAQEIRSSYPDTKFVLLGDTMGHENAFTLDGGGVLNAVAKWPYMQSLALVKMADFVLGPETSLLVGAGLFGVPKSMICTTLRVEQGVKYQANDFSVQSLASCSPCHRAVYNPKWCNYREHRLGLMPECNYSCDKARILEGVAFAHSVRGLRETVEKHDGPGFGSLPEMQPLLDSKVDRYEEVQLGVLPEVRALCQDTVRVGDQPLTVGDDFKISEW
jgi:ADP-heptose:LPS heptosyltransferase